MLRAQHPRGRVCVFRWALGSLASLHEGRMIMRPHTATVPDLSFGLGLLAKLPESIQTFWRLKCSKDFGSYGLTALLRFRRPWLGVLFLLNLQSWRALLR